MICKQMRIFIVSESKNSTLKAVDVESIRFVEKWCEVAFFVPMVIKLACAIEGCTTNAGNNAFQLPFLLWYEYPLAASGFEFGPN